jgi:ferritin-like metal-binding protein YciE
MKIETLQDLFEVGLRYAYDCEQKLVKKGIPTMAEASSSPELRQAFEEHLQQTRSHVARLEQAFAAIGREPDTEDNDVFDEMSKLAEKKVKAIESPALRDASLIASGNEVEHYEIALYGSLIAFAQQLGLSNAASSLQQTLQEEKAADAKLTRIGETSINSRATQLRAA